MSASSDEAATTMAKCGTTLVGKRAATAPAGALATPGAVDESLLRGSSIKDVSTASIGEVPWSSPGILALAGLRPAVHAIVVGARGSRLVAGTMLRVNVP